MNHSNITVDKIKQKLSKFPNDKLIEIDDFINFLTTKIPKSSPNFVKFEGIWKGLGFEKIKDLESEIRDMRNEVTTSILNKVL